MARMISCDDLALRRPLDEGEKIETRPLATHTGVHVGDCLRADRLLGSAWRPVHAPEAEKLQRITEAIWWYRHTGAHSAEALRLGKQTLCQLSYSRSVPLNYSVCLSAKPF